MTGNKKKWAIAVVAGAFTTALVGGVAIAAVQPFAAHDQTAIADTLAGPTQKPRPNDLKATLDALVTRGTITQGQEDAILQAMKDNAPLPKPKLPVAPNIRSFIGNMTRVATTYLGISEKDLAAQLRAGKSISEITTSLHKSTTDLAALLTKNATDTIDQALAANKLSADQATTLKTKIAAEVTTFLQRSFTKPAPRPQVPLKPTPAPTP
jgi:hypothetical protein